MQTFELTKGDSKAVFELTKCMGEQATKENTGYYVTVKRDQRCRLLSGPYTTHRAALEQVATVRRIACRLDPWCDFDAFGTAKIVGAELPEGIVDIYIEQHGKLP